MVYYGLYRGIVVDSNDPMGIGRAMVNVPSVGIESWAPVALPPSDEPPGKFEVGAAVAVAFEGGDVSRPVVLGQVGGPRTSTPKKK